MSQMKYPYRSRGTSLMELALVLVLLAMALGIANKLFMSCTVIQRDAIKSEQDIVWSDSVVRLIRLDVWGSAKVTSDKPDQVVLDMPDGSTVCWELRQSADEQEPATLIYRISIQHGKEIADDPLYAPDDLVFETKDNDLYLICGEQSVRLYSAKRIMKGQGS